MSNSLFKGTLEECKTFIKSMNLPPLITIPLPITTEFVQKHQQYIFIYGGAVKCDSELGQASVCSQCDNTYDVPVRWSMCKSSGFFNDGQLQEIKWRISQSVDTLFRLHSDKPIIVLPKIGLGGSRMKEFAPKAHDYLMEHLRSVAYSNVQFVKVQKSEVGDTINTSLL